MKKTIFCITLLLIICLCETACGDISGNGNQTSSTAIPGEAISENKQSESVIPTEMTLKTPYDDSDAIFTIKESNSQEYRAEVSICADLDDVGEQPAVHWELYLELADEIKEISGAKIVSHEGTHYIIRGDTPKHSPDDEQEEDEWELNISFEITVSWQGQIHEPRLCFFSKELWDVPNKKYDCQFTSLKKDGKNITGTIRLSNRSGKKIAGWELSMDSNFQITSLEGEYASYAFEYFTDDDEEDQWKQNIYANSENIDLEAGETRDISFTGICPADKPKLDNGFTLLEQCDVDDTETWASLENEYGARYGKMETYLVADTVWGSDLLFVFDEKTADGYTATAELTNVVPDSSPGSEKETDLAQSIADWEIYLECEDTIESITGAEIVSHEGNVYYIRASDPTQWIEPYSFTTFQVKVSCPAGIHPLGKTYLKRAKIRAGYGSEITEEEREFSFGKDAFQQAVSTKWLSYNDFYDPFYDTDYFDSDSDFFSEKWKGFVERQKWGKKMGRMLE